MVSRTRPVFLREIRKIVDHTIPTRGEWIRRSRRARDLLISRHNFNPDDFHIVDTSAGDAPCLRMSPLYPRSWADRIGRFGQPIDFVDERRIPSGLILLWPEGVDHSGEAHDPLDPILILEDCEFCASVPFPEGETSTDHA